MKKFLMMVVALASVMALPMFAKAEVLTDSTLVETVETDIDASSIIFRFKLKENFDMSNTGYTLTTTYNGETSKDEEVTKFYYYSEECEDGESYCFVPYGLVEAGTEIEEELWLGEYIPEMVYTIDISFMYSSNVGEIVTIKVDNGKISYNVTLLGAEEGPVIANPSKSQLQEIMESKLKTTIESKDKTYAWTFDGSKMTSADFDLDLEISFSAQSQTIKLPATVKSALFLDFAYDGKLPEGTSVKVSVMEMFANGKKLALYYYNPQTKKLERVADGLEVKDGYVEFALEHCSEWVLVEETNNLQTSNINVVLLAILAIGGALATISLLATRKE